MGPVGEKGNTFYSCPESPNCVSSTLDSDNSHYVAPIEFNDPIDLAKKKLVGAINELGNCKIKKFEGDYIWAECTSSLFKFVDDLEILFTDKKIHLKSASRVGHSDLGVNRKRINEISFKFHQSAIR